ncbi:MAG: hypothetical protein AB7Q76_18465 [Gammaproteobacteria bacterium]
MDISSKRMARGCAVLGMIAGVSGQAAAAYYDWSVFTQQFTYGAGFPETSACNAASGSAACDGYGEIGDLPSIDRALVGAAGYATRGHADLARGELGISAEGPFPYDVSISNAGFTDALTLAFPGTSIDVRIRLDVEGSFADGGYVGALFTAVPGASFANRAEIAPYWLGTFDGGPSSPVSPTVFSLDAAPGFGAVSSAGTWSVTGQDMFETAIEVLASDPVLAFRYTLYGSGELDLMGTGRIALILPAGTTVLGSDSGTLLSAGELTTVPLPASLPFLIAGCIATARVMRRR